MNDCRVNPGILICAFRYALGRRSYVVGEVIDAIEVNLPELDGFEEILAEEIDDAESRGSLGMECDRKAWLELREKLPKFVDEVSS